MTGATRPGALVAAALRLRRKPGRPSRTPQCPPDILKMLIANGVVRHTPVTLASQAPLPRVVSRGATDRRSVVLSRPDGGQGPRLLDVAGVARYLSVSQDTVRQWQHSVLAGARVRPPGAGGRMTLRRVLFDRIAIDEIVRTW